MDTSESVRGRLAFLLGGVLMLVLGSRADAWQAVELVASTEARTPDEERAAFRLPPGFEAQLVASEPDIQKPMNLAFDAQGRLWVTHSREYPYPAEEGTTPRDGVTILSDFGPDGRARSIVRFAEGLNIPIGVLPLGRGDEALVHSIPNLYHMVDDDGDGRADRKDVWYSAIGFRDTHGMASAFTWGFDGWIYGCHGFANDSTIAGRDGQAVRMNSGNTYRLRPDGSHIEQRTWGQVNPFGLAFDPLGYLYSCDCHSRPIYQLLAGAYYPSFGKPDDGLGYGPEMCPHDHGSTGIAGISYYAAEQFPEAYRGTIFIGNVVTSRINHDRVTWHGTSPAAVEQPDFLVSEDPWFRPVDIELGPDGALYVADFYNKIIGHYEVPLTHPGRDRERGRIWRIVYRGPEPHAEPSPPRADWTTASVAELFDDLGHANLAVQTLASNELVRRGGPDAGQAARNAFADASNSSRRVRGLWLLHRLAELTNEVLATAAADPLTLVRAHAMRVLGEQDTLDETLRKLVLEGLHDADPHVRRASAEALGRHRSAATVRPLLATRFEADPNDTHLVHVIRMSLRDQLREPDAWPAIDEASWSRAELQAIADVATGVPSIEAARFLVAYLSAIEESPENRRRFVHHIARHGDESLDGRLLELCRGVRPDDLGFQADQIQQVAQGIEERGGATPESIRSYALDLARKLFEAKTDGGYAAGFDLANALRIGELFEPIAEVARSPEPSSAIREAALNTLAVLDRSRAVEELDRTLMDAAAPVEVRARAADLLGQGGSPAARERLLAALVTAPSRLQAPIATAVATQREGAEALLAMIEAGKVSPQILTERPVEVRLRNAGVADIDRRIEELTQGLPPADEAVQSLLNQRRQAFAQSRGDEERGVKVFEKQCAICHKIGGVGAQIGPQLDGVGVRGPERLIEDVLDPNRNVDQAFRTTVLALDDGRVLSGLLLREEGALLVLADAKGQEIRVARDSVEERQVSPVSPMPADLSAQIPEDAFFDLLTYLLSRREGTATP